MTCHTRRRNLVAAGLLASVVLAACSSDSTDSSTTVATASATTTTSASDGQSTTTVTPTGTPVDITIAGPAGLSTHIATVDLGDGRLAAPVRLMAEVTTPPGETVVVVWSSDLDGPLGEGLTLEAQLSNDGEDVVTHMITATATASGGGVGTATLSVVVRVPSN